MTYTLVFDTSESSANRFTEDAELELSFVSRSEPDIRRDWSTTTTNTLEQNVNFSVAQRKKGTVTIVGDFYNDGKDKSNGTIQKAINNGDISVVNDNRIKTPLVNSVDTTNDTFTVSGDFTRSGDTDSTLVVFQSTGNDNIYNIDNVNYDSNNDETTFEVAENVSDSTADGFIQTGVFDLLEKIAWLEDYVWENAGAPFHRIEGGRFDNDLDGTNVVIESVQTPRIAGQTTLEYNITAKFGVPI